jgi:hypothetical protein
MNTPEDIDVRVTLIHDPDAAIAALRFLLYGDEHFSRPHERVTKAEHGAIEVRP